MYIVRLALALLVSAGWLGAQEPVYTLSVNVPLVGLEVAVFDAAGRPVTDLSRDHFRVYEDGELQQIRNFSPVATPYNILLLFDRSGSTQDQWPFMQRAVARFLENLRPQDRIAMAAFDAEFEMLGDWIQGRHDAILQLDRLIRPKSAGGTNFYRSLERAAGKQFRDVSGRKAVIVFTDGRDTRLYRRTVTLNRAPELSEDRDFQKTLRVVQQSGTPVYLVAINTDRNLDSQGGEGNDYLMLRRIFPRSTLPHEFLIQVRRRMELLAERSGGRIFFPEKLADVIPLYDQISRELGTSYSLGYVSTSPGGAGKYRRIEVRVDDDKARIWQSREGYASR